MIEWHRETTDYWTGKRVMIIGGSGFLGSHRVDELEAYGNDVGVFAPRSSDYDLRERAGIKQAFRASQPDVVLHLAAIVGGIGANRENPGKYLYEHRHRR